MTAQVDPSFHWTAEAYLRAWDADVFDGRVELVEGEIWMVPVGSWHGRTGVRLIRLLPEAGAQVMQSTLPTAGSLPDPDCWVLRDGAVPVAVIGSRLDVWEPGDVLLVVEVSDATVVADLNRKARLYGAAGYPCYWVVTNDGVHVHTEPGPQGYGRRVVHGRGESVPVPYADLALAVDDVVGTG